MKRWCNSCARRDNCYTVPTRPKCYVPVTNTKQEDKTYLSKTIVWCPKCGRSDYIRDFEKDWGIKNSEYKYKCINCNTYIKDDIPVMYYPQVDGITPSVIITDDMSKIKDAFKEIGKICSSHDCDSCPLLIDDECVTNHCPDEWLSYIERQKL